VRQEALCPNIGLEKKETWRWFSKTNIEMTDNGYLNMHR